MKSDKQSKILLLKHGNFINNTIKSTHTIGKLLCIDSLKHIIVSGRVINHRNTRTFITIRSEYNDIQCYLTKNCNIYKQRKLIDNGDIITVIGDLGKTDSGEKTVFVESLYVQSKCCIDVCDQHFIKQDDKFSNVYRSQYLAFDLVAFKKLYLRNYMVQKIREYMYSNGIIEVETPILNEVAGGAIAKPFQVYYNVKNKNYNLRIAPELYLKKLIIAGYERIFEVAKNFRNEGISTNHNPEFTMMEIYIKEYKLNDLIKFSLDMLENIYQNIKQFNDIVGDYNFKDIVHLDHIEMKDDILSHLNQEIVSYGLAKAIYNRYKLNIDGLNSEEAISEVITKYIIPTKYKNFIVVLKNHPACTSPLAEHYDNGLYAYRYEIYINGIEVVDGYQENTNYIKQKQIFEKQESDLNRKSDMSYIHDMMMGMPRIGGIGIGIDRLAKVFTNSYNIREVIYLT